MFDVVSRAEIREQATKLPIKVRGKFDRLIDTLALNAELRRAPDAKPMGEGFFKIHMIGMAITGGIWVYPKR